MNDNMNNNNFNNVDNIAQNEYYNNDSYYANNNYDNNYSDTAYEEKEKKGGIWWKILLVILVLLIIIFLLLRFCGGKKSSDQLYAELTAEICAAAEKYVDNNPSVLDRTEPGRSTVIKFVTLSNANLIGSQIKNPYYDGGLFAKETQPKYYSLDNSVRVSVLNDGTLNCELVDNANDVTAPELRLNGDSEIILAVGTEFEDPGYTATDDYDGDITNKVVVSGNVNPSVAGVYGLTYTVQDAAGNVSTKTRKIVYEEYADIEVTLGSILDTVTPQISLKGSNPYCMVKGTQFVEPGAVATDNVDGNITDRISVTNKVTGNLMGSFRIAYKVEDTSGNQAIAYRAVIVTTECPEEQQPDNVVNTRPTITMIGKNAITINVGTEYIDLGATAYDKEDGDITSKIITDTTAVNVNSAGVYKVIYRVTDSEGLTSTLTRTVTVIQTVYGTPSVRFVEDKKNITVLAGEGDNSLISAPKAVNENGVQVSVTTSIEDYNTTKSVSSIDWNRSGKYRVIYTAIHGNGVIKQQDSIVVTINNGVVEIGGENTINVVLRNNNCDITEADLVNGGVTFTRVGSNTPIVTLSGNEGKACKLGTYVITVSARVDNGPELSKDITVNVVSGTTGEIGTGLPSKTIIIGNTASPSDVYNNSNKWIGGATTAITLTFSATPYTGTEIAHFEWSTDCQNVGGRVSKTSSTNGALEWATEGSNSVCIRAVTTTGNVGPWSDPVKLNIDRTGPSVEFTHTWKDGENDWHNSETLVVAYTAADSESGLSHFEYTYDDVRGDKTEDEIVKYDESTGRLTVSENTEPERTKLFIFVRAVDNAGNRGEWTLRPAYVNIDTVKPNKPTLEAIGNGTSNVQIKGTFSDGNSRRPSGFGKYIYTEDGGSEKTSTTETFAVSSNLGNSNVKKQIVVWAVDKAGNVSNESASKEVTVAPSTNRVKEIKLLDGETHIGDGGECNRDTVLYPGDKFELVASPVPQDADEKNATWGVEDAEIATVDNTNVENNPYGGRAVITAKKAGTTYVNVKIGDVTKKCKLKVSKYVESKGIQIMIPNGWKTTTPVKDDNGVIQVYEPSKLNAKYSVCPEEGIVIPLGMKLMVHPEYNPLKTTDRKLTWRAYNTKGEILSVSPVNPSATCTLNSEGTNCLYKAEITAKNVGTTSIVVERQTASGEKQSDTCKVTVFDGKINDLSCKNVEMTVGDKEFFYFTYSRKNANNYKFTASIKDEKIVKFYSGKVGTEETGKKRIYLEPKKAGETTITIKDEITGMEKTCKITVKSKSSGGSSGGGTSTTTTNPTGVCCACGNSQGVNYSWSASGSCGTSCTVATTKTYATCSGSSSPTCPSTYPYVSENDAKKAATTECGAGKYRTSSTTIEGRTCYRYNCNSTTATTKKPTTCTYSNVTSCQSAANIACPRGYSGCSSANASGCYTFTCNNR